MTNRRDPDAAPEDRRGAAATTDRVAHVPTMHDVAAFAGVSLKTVSRVVNMESGVDDHTAAKVEIAIQRLAYRRNDVARSLRMGISMATIGLVIEDLGTRSTPRWRGPSRTLRGATGAWWSSGAQARIRSASATSPSASCNVALRGS